jgi:predicted nucleotidyltransferase
MVNQSIIETAKQYVHLIPVEMELKKAFLFGSWAQGTEHTDSDIDIAIVVGKMDDFFSIQMQLMRLRRSIDLRIEPHPIWEGDFNIQNPFAWEIQKTGIEIR